MARVAIDGLIIDNFAGGGGASTGIEMAVGRSVDVAINHDPEAVALHKANHPQTAHYCQSVWKADPQDVVAEVGHSGAPIDPATRLPRVGLAWFSPDCKHFSKAKGGRPVEKGIRDLAWVVVQWAERVRPAVIMLENVEEFQTWGPIGEDGRPDPAHKGKTFEKWVRSLRRLGYRVQWKELRACDYGAPTSRKRLFLIARSDKLAIVWPKPTHGKPGSPAVLSGKLPPWRTAASIIDWTIPCPSIFERSKPLADATCRRIVAGIKRYVLDAAKPFIVPVTHHGSAERLYDVDGPIPTVTAAHRGEMAFVAPTLERSFGRSTGADVDAPLPTITAGGGGKTAVVAPVIVGCGGRRAQSGPVDPDGPYPTTTAKADACVVAATMIQQGYGEREGQAPRALDIEKPIGTVVAGGGKHGVVAAFMAKYRPKSPGIAMDDPVPTVTANSFIKRPGGAAPLAVVAAHMEQANSGVVGHDMEEPVSTIVGKGCTQRLVVSSLEHADDVAAFMVKYYGNEEDGHGLDKPIGTVTTKDRFGVVTVDIDGEPYAIVDIGMRMLSPRELYAAQGFPASYIIDPVIAGKPLTKTAQIRMCGNSVCPPMAEALVRANFAVAEAEQVAA
ncbi:DNA cytosine methyltransferase [Sphingomonas sp. YL-JM2C]